MARPFGNTFTTVIEKLQAYKKQEGIVVPQQFKADFRQKLVMHIQQSAPVQVEERQELDTEKQPWWKMFTNSRYWALAPIGLFAFVTVYGLSKLPIAFDNNEYVPVANNQTTNFQSSDVASNTSTSEQLAQNNGGAKTFAGSQVMPQWYLDQRKASQQIAEQGGQGGSTSAEISDANSDLNNPTTQDLNQNSAQKDVTDSQTANNELTNQSSGVQSGASGSDTATSSSNNSVAQSNQPEQSPVANQATNAQVTSPATNPSSATATNTTVAQPLTNTEPTVQKSSNLSTISQTVGDSLKVPLNNILNPSTVGNTLNQSVVAPRIAVTQQVQLPTTLKVNFPFTISYVGQFTEEQKRKMENNVLLSLVPGRDITSVTVTKPDASHCVFALTLKDGNIQELSYKLGSDGTWILEKMVQKSPTNIRG